MEISSHKKVGFAIATSGSDRLHLKKPHRYLRSLSSSIATSGSGVREGGYRGILFTATSDYVVVVLLLVAGLRVR